MLSSLKTANLTTSVSRSAGGLYESVRRLVQSLDDKGLVVTVFGTADSYTADDVAAWEPVEVKAFRPRWHAQFGYSPEFRVALEEFEPELLHTHGLWCYPSVATHAYCRKRGVPYIISPHGMLDPWAVRNSRWKKVAARLLYEGAHLREADCIRALCESEARSIRQLGINNPIAVIPNGIDIEVADDPLAACGTPPWSGCIEPGRKVLLFLSRIHPKKGLVNLLRAWADIRKTADGARQADGWVLAIAGWDQGGHEDELKRLCTTLGLPHADISHPASHVACPAPDPLGPPSVLFLGPQFKAAKQTCYAHCGGFILPSFSEGVPMVVLEAWVYNKPVVMTPECNLPEAFPRGAAIRIETNPASIAQGLGELFRATEPELRELGGNGNRLIRERFSWPQIADQMCMLYAWMLGRGDKPECLWEAGEV